MTYNQLLQNGYVSVSDFASRHENITENQVYIAKSTSESASKFIIKTEFGFFVNEKALIRRREFYHRVWREATDNYFKIIDGSSQWKLALLLSMYFFKTNEKGAIARFYQYLDKYLFSVGFMDKSILSTKINNTLWIFWRFSRWVIRRLQKRQDAIYKRLPNRDRYEEIYRQRGCVR